MVSHILLCTAAVSILIGQTSSFQLQSKAITRRNSRHRSEHSLSGPAKILYASTSPTTKENDAATSTIAKASSMVDEFCKSFGSLAIRSSTSPFKRTSLSPGAAFLQAVANGDIDRAMTFVDDAVEYFDTAFPSPLNRQQLERNLRLQVQLNRDDTALSYLMEKDICDTALGKAGVVFRRMGKKGAAFYQFNQDGLITKAFYVEENQKQGAINLQILKIASDIIRLASSPKQSSSITTNQVPGASVSSALSLPEQYFDAWNERDLSRAISVFSSGIEYDDTAFPEPFQGKDALEKHLNLCADALPKGFSFVLDDKLDVGDQVMIRWHVENNGDELPFTKGCSFYEIKKGKITEGIDWKEPAVFKVEGLNIFFSSFLKNVKREPVRLIPMATWIVYCYVVFFSDWFYGLPAQALETRTWEEVRDLSLNFFLVSPILGLPFAPVVHPGLEGIFNLLLSWAALFAGFLSDDRRKKPNPLPMLPTVVGMQFLTSAFLLPYLATRSTEVAACVQKEELTVISRATESRLLGPSMGIVGTGSILWGLFARDSDFGGISERYSSLVELLSIDRVGSSFLVDLAIFGLFQGWLVEDDLKRRGANADSLLYNAAKYVPFFGLVAYLTLRPSYPSSASMDESKQRT
ncbi:SnoaL-like domain containing protein [Nitzschia inconspicua]|uniref:SnoaL-like domain containing protein n=1 Tax=Nitzschia inconspicua TaxID=303405 RepID=A0A9K3PQJ7_9STRA|nr:SnoaL-like domain containing protein [Nitzschia inconspicua]